MKIAFNTYKVRTTDSEDIFSYRDEYNEEHLVGLPKFWQLSDKEAEDYLNHYENN